MTKKLHVDNITNELEGSVFFPGRDNESVSGIHNVDPDPLLQEVASPDEPLDEPPTLRRQVRLSSQAGDASLERPISQLTDGSIGQLTAGLNRSPMPKPRGLYISQQLDARLDHAVRYFQTVHGIKKVDRSLLINAMLLDESYWTEKSLNQLIDPLIDLLTRRLTGQ